MLNKVQILELRLIIRIQMQEIQHLFVKVQKGLTVDDMSRSLPSWR